MVTPEEIPFLQIGEIWPPQDSINRLDRYEKNKELFKGEHSNVYANTILTRLLREDNSTVELALNFPGAVSKLFADLLFGEQPKFKPQNDEEDNKWIDEFISKNKLHQLNYKAALAQSYRGEAIYKVRLVSGKAVLDVIPASIWFPYVDPDNVTDILAHVLAWTKDTELDGKPVKLLKCEIHVPGLLYNRIFKLNSSDAIEQDITDQFDVEQEVETGVEYPLVVHVPNIEIDDSVFGLDDYIEADTLFRELDVRLSQIAKILDKHSDPGMYGPDTALEFNKQTGKYEVKADGYIAMQPGDPEPGYLTWDAQLEANWKFIDQIMQGLYIATDTNAAAFSLETGGNVPSGAALKRLLIRPLARTNRKRNYFDPALKRVISIASQLERGKDITVDIQWQDGIPADPLEQAQIEQIRTGNKPTTSQRSAIMRLDNVSEESAQNELEAIQEEELSNTPIIPTTDNTLQFGENE